MAEGGYWNDDTDHDRVPFNNHHCQVQWQQDSLETCTLMNLLGYGCHIRQARRDAYREYDRIVSAQGMVTFITTGSKAEGLTSFFESDRDVMIVQKDVICVENDVNSCTLPRDTTVFKLKNGMCYHGHCRLYLEKRPGTIISPAVRNALCSITNGRAVLSSDLYVNALNDIEHEPNEVRHERAGPSMPRSIQGVSHIDFVRSLHCYCPSILRKWAERNRHWPPPDVIHKVVSMGAFVTPVGFKGSEYKHVEWRICFNTKENELVSYLNNTQIYIDVILKMVVKEVLAPLKKELSSYTVKNIVLWLAENNPQELFHERSLFYWLREGLVELRSAICTEHLSYYMIPERNLMAACGLDKMQKRAWLQIITDMINEGPKVLLRLQKIQQAIILHPEPMLWYGKKRVELELLQLKNEIRMGRSRDGNGVVNESDTMVQAIRTRMIEIVAEFHQRIIRDGSRVDMNYILELMLM